MLIPSIDLMGGKIVQLVQGSKKALEFDNFDEWIERFSEYPLVQLIDLDAAMGTGNNRSLVQEIAHRLPCQVGGGIRSIASAHETLAAGACRVILGSSLISEGNINSDFAGEIGNNISLGNQRRTEDHAARSGRQCLMSRGDRSNPAPDLAWKPVGNLLNQTPIVPRAHCSIEIDELHQRIFAEPLNPFVKIVELERLFRSLNELHDLPAHKINRRNQHGHLTGIPAEPRDCLSSPRSRKP